MLDDKFQDPTSLSIISRSFSDIDQLAELIQIKWGETRIDQLSLQPFGGSILQANFKDFMILKTNLDCPIHHTGDRPQGFIMFLFLLDSSEQSSALIQKERVDKNTLWGFDCTRDSNTILPAHTSLLIVHIKQEIFEEYCQLMERDDLLESAFYKQDKISLPLTLSTYRNYIRELLYLVERQGIYHESFT